MPAWTNLLHFCCYNLRSTGRLASMDILTQVTHGLRHWSHISYINSRGCKAQTSFPWTISLAWAINLHCSMAHWYCRAEEKTWKEIKMIINGCGFCACHIRSISPVIHGDKLDFCTSINKICWISMYTELCKWIGDIAFKISHRLRKRYFMHFKNEADGLSTLAHCLFISHLY